MSLLIKYSFLFGGEELPDPMDLIKPYGRNLVMKIIALLNSFIQQEMKDVKLQVVNWFGQGDYADQILQRIAAAYGPIVLKEKGLFLINAYSNLRFNELAMMIPDANPVEPFDHNQGHLALFKAYLVLNERFIQTQDHLLQTLPENYEGIEKATWMISATLISHFDFTYCSEKSMLIGLVKSFYCFSFIEMYNSKLYKAYLNSLGVDSFRDYAKRILPLASLCFSEVKEINAKSDEDDSFLQKLSFDMDISEESGVGTGDFLEIRNRPLYRIGEKSYLLLNRAMVVSKIYGGIYWGVKSIIEDDKSFGISVNKFRIDYTTDFSEGLLVYKLLQKSYRRKSYKQFSGKEMQTSMRSNEPDYYVRNGNKQLLFEVKDSFISGEVKQSFEVKKIETELRSKFYKFEKEDGKIKEKAVQQLITRIGYAARKKFPFDTSYKIQNLRIYPILVVYDINLTVPGIERLLVDWFDQERDKLMKELAQEGITGLKIQDLVILHIDGLTMLSEYLSIGRFSLENLIDEHNLRIKFLRRFTNKKTFDQLKTDVLNSYLSFNDFVMTKIDAIPKDRKIMMSEIRELFYNID
ncbi:MAG: hypothetical protein J7577_03970 [Sphingobacteriaceae bacterium]|nr:hypothetical protein [Sphingobacteriaceae bacterium]